MPGKNIVCRTCLLPAIPKRVFPLQSKSCLPDPETIEQMLTIIVPELNLKAIANPVLCKDCLLKLRTSFRFRRMCVRNESMQRAHAGKEMRSIIKRAVLLDHEYEIEERESKENLTCVENSVNSFRQQNVLVLPTIVIEAESEQDHQLEEVQDLQQEEIIVDNLDTFEVPIEPITYNVQDYPQYLEKEIEFSQRDNKSLDKHETNNSLESKFIYADVFLRNDEVTAVLSAQSPNVTTNKLVCSKCPKICSTYGEAALHAQHEHNKKRTICCKICNKFFTSTYLYKKHAKSHGFNVKNLIKAEPLKLECKECKTTFRKSHFYCKHMIKYHQKSFPKCDTCHKSFPSVRFLKLHISRHIRDGIKRNYLCDVCGMNFSEYRIYYEHKSTHKKEFHCELCDKKFTKKSSLQLHLSNIHTSEKKHMCELCGMQFKYPHSLITHKGVHHGESTKNTYCPICGKGFYYRSTLKNHLLAIHKGLKPHKCDICDRCFTNPGNLKRHMRVHTGEKPFVCVYCGRKFAKATSLSNHQSVKGDAQCKGLNGPRECEICKRRFKFKGLLTKHLKVHNDVERKTQNDASVTCEICGRPVSSKTLLKKHMKTHSNEKNYVCDICGKSFTRRYGLGMHYRVHTGEKPFQCHLCGESFINKGILQRHQRKVHFLNAEAPKDDKTDEIQSNTVIQYHWEAPSK